MDHFQQIQFVLTRHLRDPDANPAPDGIEDRRLGIYRDLIYNNFEGFIAGAFPVLRSITPDSDWHRLVRDFIAHHSAQTPYFLAISQEFLHYLMTERQPEPGDYPFMLQLAHYEWVELAVDIAEGDLPPLTALPEGLLAARPQISPLVMNLAYDFPVHRIGSDFIPQAPEPSFLLVYRNQKDEVRFMESNALTHRMIFLLQEVSGRSLAEVIDQLQTELQHPQPEVFVQQAIDLVQKLHSDRIISHFE